MAQSEVVSRENDGNTHWNVMEHALARLVRIVGPVLLATKILAVAVDDIQQSIRIIDMAKEHFAQLEIAPRATDVTHSNVCTANV